METAQPRGAGRAAFGMLAEEPEDVVALQMIDGELPKVEPEKSVPSEDDLAAQTQFELRTANPASSLAASGAEELDLLVEDSSEERGLIGPVVVAHEQSAPAFEYVEKKETPSAVELRRPSPTTPTSPDEALGACLILTRSECLFVWEQLESAILYARKTSGVEALRRTIELVSHGAALNSTSGSETARRSRQDALLLKQQLLERQRIHLRLLTDQSNDVSTLLNTPTWTSDASQDPNEARSVQERLRMIHKEIKKTKDYINTLKMTVAHLEGQLKCHFLLDDDKEAKLKLKHLRKTEIQTSPALVTVEKLLKALLWSRRKERHIVSVRKSLEKEETSISRSVLETLDLIASEYDMAEHFAFLKTLPKVDSEDDGMVNSFDSNVSDESSASKRSKKQVTKERSVISASPLEVTEALKALISHTPKRNVRNRPASVNSTPEAKGRNTPKSNESKANKASPKQKGDAKHSSREKEQDLLLLVEKQRREIESFRRKEFDMKCQLRLLRQTISKSQNDSANAKSSSHKLETDHSDLEARSKGVRLASPPDSAIDRDAAYKVDRSLTKKFSPARKTFRRRTSTASKVKIVDVEAKLEKDEQPVEHPTEKKTSIADAPSIASPPDANVDTTASLRNRNATETIPQESRRRRVLENKVDLSVLRRLHEQLRSGSADEATLQELEALPLEGGFQLGVYVEHARSLPTIKKTSKSADTYVRAELYLGNQGPVGQARTDTEWDTVYPKWRQRLLLPSEKDVSSSSSSSSSSLTEELRYWSCGSGAREGWLAPDVLAKCTLVCRVFQDLKLGEENDQEVCYASAPVKDLLLDRKLVWLRVRMSTSVPRSQRVRVSTDAAIRVKVGLSGPLMTNLRSQLKALQEDRANEETSRSAAESRTAASSKAEVKVARERRGLRSTRNAKGESSDAKKRPETTPAEEKRTPSASRNFFMQPRYRVVDSPASTPREVQRQRRRVQQMRCRPEQKDTPSLGATYNSNLGSSRSSLRSSRSRDSSGRSLPWESITNRDDLDAIEDLLPEVMRRNSLLGPRVGEM